MRSRDNVFMGLSGEAQGTCFKGQLPFWMKHPYREDNQWPRQVTNTKIVHTRLMVPLKPELKQSGLYFNHTLNM